MTLGPPWGKCEKEILASLIVWEKVARSAVAGKREPGRSDQHVDVFIVDDPELEPTSFREEG
jgi:hypothetical protein